jgi:hypothetical protein
MTLERPTKPKQRLITLRKKQIDKKETVQKLDSQDPKDQNPEEVFKLWWLNHITLGPSYACTLAEVYDQYEKDIKENLKKIPLSKRQVSKMAKSFLTGLIETYDVKIETRSKVTFRGMEVLDGENMLEDKEKLYSSFPSSL